MAHVRHRSKAMMHTSRGDFRWSKTVKNWPRSALFFEGWCLGSLFSIQLRAKGLLVILSEWFLCLRKAVRNLSNMKLEPSRLIQYSQSYSWFPIPFLVPVLIPVPVDQLYSVLDYLAGMPSPEFCSCVLFQWFYSCVLFLCPMILFLCPMILFLVLFCVC